MILFSIESVFLFGGMGAMEYVWILLAILLLFGGKKIPELARGIGKGIREFNDAKDGIKKEIETGGKEVNDRKEAAKKVVEEENA